MPLHYLMPEISHNQVDVSELDKALRTFEYASKVRLSLLLGVSPAAISNPHDKYGSYKEFYPVTWTARSVASRLAAYSAKGFIPWGFEKKGAIEARFESYQILVKRAMSWAFNHVLVACHVDQRQLAAHLALTIILAEEGLYSWALNL